VEFIKDGFSGNKGEEAEIMFLNPNKLLTLKYDVVVDDDYFSHDEALEYIDEHYKESELKYHNGED
jgi:hypothetical protein